MQVWPATWHRCFFLLFYNYHRMQPDEFLPPGYHVRICPYINNEWGSTLDCFNIIVCLCMCGQILLRDLRWWWAWFAYHIRSYTADAVLYRQPSGQPTNTVMLNLNWLRVEEVSWQWSVGRVTVPQLSTWYDVTWRDIMRHNVTWRDATLRNTTWHDVRSVSQRNKNELYCMWDGWDIVEKLLKPF